MVESGNWIRAMFDAKSIAVVGASDNPIKLSGRPIDYLKRFGYAGDIYPVNVSRETVQGLPAYRDLESIGKVPEIAMLMVSAAAAAEAIRECGRLGVSVAIVSAAGFAETGESGAALQDELRSAITESGVRVLGPNCLGLIGFQNKLTATFTSALDQEQPIQTGTTALVSQSGAFGTFIFSAARLSGVEFSHYANTGNESDLDVVEILMALCDSPEVRTLSAYFEGLSRGERLADLGLAALKADKPIIVAKSGRTPAGARAVSSHTASLVGSDAVFKDVCDQYGIIAVESINDIVDMMVVFDQDRRAAGPKLTILTLSGGAAALMTDIASDQGIEVNRWDAQWQQRVKAGIPTFGSPINPIDLTAELIKDPEILRRALDVVIEHPGTDVISVLVGNAAHGADRLVEIIANANARTAKPIVVVWTGDNRKPLAALAERKIAAFDDPARAARAIAAMVSYNERREFFASNGYSSSALVPSELKAEGRSRVEQLRQGGATRLDELTASQLFKSWGVAVAEGVQVDSAENAWDTAQEGGLPCVIKLLSSGIAHKSDAGGVLLNLSDRESIMAAFEKISAVGDELQLDDSRVMVQPMVIGDGDAVELIVGAHRDISFGQVVTVGFGGVLVDVLDDSVSLLPPFGREEACRGLGRLRGSRLLGAFRGRSARDVEALITLLVNFGSAVVDLQDEVEEMELNPVIVRATGEGVIGVDALVNLVAE